MFRYESDKTLAQCGFKDLEVVMLHQTVEEQKADSSVAGATFTTKPMSTVALSTNDESNLVVASTGLIDVLKNH